MTTGAGSSLLSCLALRSRGAVDLGDNSTPADGVGDSDRRDVDGEGEWAA